MMTMSIQPHRLGCGEDITTNTMTGMEKKKRAYRRKDCGDTNTSTVKRAYRRDTNTSTVMVKEKRVYGRKDCGDTNTSTVMEKEKKCAYRRKDWGDTNTSTVMEKEKKSAYRRKDWGDTNTSTVMEKEKKSAYRRKDWGDTNTPTLIVKEKKSAYRRKDCGDMNTSTEKEKRAYRRKDCGESITPAVMVKERRSAYRRKDCGDTNMSTEKEKRAYRKKDCGDTNMSTEKEKMAYRRKDCPDANIPSVLEKEKRAYRRKDCGDTITSTVIVKEKRTDGRKDCGDTNTSIAMEKEKRVYGRKDCGDTNMSTVMVKEKKSAYGRKDCGDTKTSFVMVKEKKSAYRRKDCGDTKTSTVMVREKKSAYGRKDCSDTKTSTVMVKEKKSAYRRKDCGGTNTPIVMEKKSAYRGKNYLPHDLIMEEILTKLPVRTLLKSVLVSKLWYNSIHNDNKHLTYSHFLQSQKQPDVILSLLNVKDDGVVKKTGEPARYGCHFFKFTPGIYSDDDENALEFDKFRGGLVGHDIWEQVGYCHGLPCMAIVGNYSTGYVILDANRKDFMYIYPAIDDKCCVSSACIICHGFGFDPSANEYKLVSIFRTTQKELNVVVFTLGTKLWRNVTATSTPISCFGGRLITKIRVPTCSDKSAIFCPTSSRSGCLVWKIITTLGGAGSNDIQHENSNAVNNETEMLLSFNLNDEKLQFIQLPAKSTTVEQKKNLLVDYPHLLEFKGSPCIARTEKISANGSDYPHRCRDDHQGSSNCCCCCKVHLYVLKDNFKQVWVKEESFDVHINSSPEWLVALGHLAPEPCCFCIGSTTTPPTRIYSFSDQVLLYWFNGDSLQVYNLRSEKLQFVLPFKSSKVDVLFRAKMKEPRRKFNSGDDDIYCSNMDYQLHCHEENLLSLQTFIPEGVAGVDADVLNEIDLKREERPCSAYVCIYRGSKVFYPLLN
ncbi:hypothetical protein MKW92_007850 [Papaver armeniacum]|nr:hypothetical protein MKW92_007850 [Papaver armeniacum]